MRKELTKGIQYWQQTGRCTYKISEAVHTLIKNAISGFDDHVHQVFRNLDVMSKSEVRDMVDKLAERLVDVEQGQSATTHFHTVKPAEIDDSFAHKVSVDMGPHTKPRAPIPV